MKIKRECLICHKIFLVKPYCVKKGLAKYCSRICQSKGHSKDSKGNKHWNWKGGNINRTCDYCGGNFTAKRIEVHRGHGRFCSRKCFGKWNRVYNIGMKNPNWKGGRIKKQCLMCGKGFTIAIAWTRKGEVKFCSRKCFGKSIANENHPRWKGGVSFEPYPSEFNKKLKLAIRTRDGFICQECGYSEEELGYKLPIHHVDYDKGNNDSNNLISLCKNCHGQVNFSRETWTRYYQEKIQKPSL